MFLLLLVLRCFTSQGALPPPIMVGGYQGLLDRVSPFGNLRIKDCFASTRSLSQQRHVLHRLLKSRHPPYALKFPVKKFINHIPPLLFNKKVVGGKQSLKDFYLDRSRIKYFSNFSLSGREKTLTIVRQNLYFQFSNHPDFSTKKPLFKRPTSKNRACLAPPFKYVSCYYHTDRDSIAKRKKMSTRITPIL